MAIDVMQDGDELIIRVHVDSKPADELVQIAREPLAKHGLELKPIQRFINAGTLKVVEVGRRRFTKLSYLLALVDQLPAPKSAEPEDDIAAAARKRAARRAS